MGDEKKKGGFGIGKLLVYGVLLIAVLGAGVFIYGNSLPEEHITPTATRDINRWPIACYTAVADVQNVPKWASGVKEVRDVKKDGNKITYTQVLKDGTEMFSTMELGFASTKITVSVRDSRDYFTGKWEFSFKDAGEGKCKVTLVETGKISNPLMRAMFNLFGDMNKTVNEFLDDLKKKVESDKPSS